MEKYLLTPSTPDRINLTKYRLSNHKLPIEIGRHVNIEKGDRTWEFCTNYDIGDEMHYMLICSKFKNERTKLLPRNCVLKPSSRKYCDIMKTDNIKLLCRLARMSKIIMNAFV